jgi:hypothetical protein
MRTTTTTAVVLAGAALALPAAADANADGPPPRVLLRAPLAQDVSLATAARVQRAGRLRERAVHLARALDRAQGRRVRVGDERRRVDDRAVPRLRDRVRTLHHRLTATRTPATPAATPTAPAPATTPPASAPSGTLQAIAACESGGSPSAVGGGGSYRGKYQFDQQTWESVGGTGDPAAASEAEQDQRAAALYAREGTTAWPTCGG